MTIENELQLATTLAWISKFTDTLNEYNNLVRPDCIHPRLWQAQRDGIESMLETLRAEVADYEARKPKSV